MTYSISVLNVCKIESHKKYFNDELRTDSDVVKLFGKGFFYIPFTKEVNAYPIRNGVSTAEVNFHLQQVIDEQWFEKNKQEKWDLQIISHKPYGCKIEKLTIDVICEKSLYEKLENFSCNNNAFEISFNIINWENFEGADDENSYQSAKAKIDSFEISSQSNFAPTVFADCEVKDIQNYLIRTNCFATDSGQIAEICKEFAESFRQVSSSVDKNELLNQINSLIASYRDTFHSHLNDDDAAKLKSFKEKYGFEVGAYAKNHADELKKITNKKDEYQAIRILSHLWGWKKAENLFGNSYPFSLDEASFLTDEYIKLKHIHSETCERILFDVLISTSIIEYADDAQINQCISPQTLLSIKFGFYKPELSEVKSKNLLSYFSELLFNSTFHIVGRVISGLISWFISGLIAGNNDTARIVLFGTMFAADTVLMGLYKNHQLKNEKQVASAREENYFNLIKKMCTLHSCSFVMDVKIMRHMLNELASSGVNFQLEVLQLLSKIENRK
jgi:hypothetical protein